MRDGVAGGLNIEAVQVIGDTPVPVTDPRSKSGLALVIPPLN
jgi:gamma-glutamyltranspeptidase/glutathione hydrolase